MPGFPLGFPHVPRGETHGRKTTPRPADQSVRLGPVPGVQRGKRELLILQGMGSVLRARRRATIRISPRQSLNEPHQVANGVEGLVVLANGQGLSGPTRGRTGFSLVAVRTTGAQGDEDRTLRGSSLWGEIARNQVKSQPRTMTTHIEGFATAEGTHRWATKSMTSHHLPALHFRVFDSLTLTSIGMGTYLGKVDEVTDAFVTSAVERSIRSGALNVLDSAANYRLAHGERAIGLALRQLISKGEARRDEVFVATKNGYAADPDLLKRMVSERKISNREVFRGVNCMSPCFLEDQLERSRENLGIATVDLLYLHNVTDEQVAVLGRDEFLARLRDSFEFLEMARARVHLRYYGLATWDTFRSPPESPNHLDLEEVVSLAQSVGGEHHGFRFLQFPFNPRMPEAVMLRTQRIGVGRGTLLEVARSLGVGTFSSVPLMQGRLPAREALQFARSAPGHIAPLVGQKDPGHVEENLSVAALLPWSSDEFGTYLSTLRS